MGAGRRTPGPPRAAERILGWALGPSEAARSIRGDLAEDFARAVGERGRVRAGLWYWKESLALALGALPGRVLGRPPSGRGSGGSAPAWMQDARYALRAVRRDPAYFVFASLIVGLGVGAATAVFSVMSPLMIRPLPFSEPERLVWIENGDGTGGMSALTSRTSNLRDFREMARSFDGLAGYNAFFTQRSYNLVGAGEPERLVGVDVTHDFLDVLGVDPLLGRSFTPEEGLWDGPRAVILTHGYWMRRFGGDPSVVGTSLNLNDVPWQVVGILPPSFDFSSVFTPATTVDFLRPWPVTDETDNWGNTTTIVGRLRPGVSIEAAQAELEGILVRLQEADPRRWGIDGVHTTGLQERMAQPFRTAMLLLAGAAGLVMLIVCVNLSNMLLARSPRRRREMAVRRTLGATRGRLVRQLLLESVYVSLSGAAVGLALAVAVTRFVSGTGGLDLPMLSAVSVDAMALGFSVAIALLAGLAVGIVPALQVAEGGEAEALSGSARGASAGRSGRRLREALVVVEVATACVLLVVGGLVLKSFQRVMEVDVGFPIDDKMAWQISTPRDFQSLGEAVAFYDQVVTEVEAVPGVEAAGLVDALPLGRNRTWCGSVVGFEQENGQNPCFYPHIVGSRYIPTMEIELLEGRLFEISDDRSSDWVVIVNERAARTMFPDGEALGQRLDMWFGEAEVVGVVGDVRHRALDLSGDPEVYFPMAQVWDFNTLDLVVRSRLPLQSLLGPVGAAIRGVDPQMPTRDVRTLASVVDRSVSPRRFTLQVLAAFALSSLLLAALGIYGVLSYAVTERIPEIGIRMALGESGGEIRRALVGRTLALAAIGVGLGSLASYFGGRLVGSLLYQVEPTDPSIFGATVAILIGVSVLSGLIPAIRASRVDSATALRST